MPPKKSFDCTVFVFDVNSSDEFKERAVKCYLELCALKMFTGKNDMCKLLLINTDETNNFMAKKGKYQNIVEATQIGEYNLEDRVHIDSAVPAHGNWLEGLNVGIQKLVDLSSQSSVSSLQLVMFSDLNTTLSMSDVESSKLVEKVIEDINDYSIYTLFLGVEIPTPKIISTKHDVYEWMQSLQFSKLKLQIPEQNVDIIDQIVKNAECVACDLDVGLDMVELHKQHKKKQPWLVPLMLDELELTTVTSKLIDKETGIMIKQCTEGIPEIIYVSAEDETKIINDPLIKGLVLYDKLVVIPPDVNKGVKDYERFFKLLGFTDAVNIPDHFMLSTSTNQVFVDIERHSNAKALYYLILVAKKLNKYGIAIRAYMKNCTPKLYCLIPKPELDPPSFLMVELPYAEDIDMVYKQDEVTRVKKIKHEHDDDKVDDEFKETVYSYLDSMEIEGKVKMHPSLRMNLSNRLICKQLIAKHFGNDFEDNVLPVGDFMVQPDPNFSTKLKSMWNIGEAIAQKTNDDDTWEI